MRYDAVIIGGGAAGLLCAATAAKLGLKTIVAETRERPARKILVTGKGRCNVTNHCTPEEFLKNVRSNPKFLFSAAARFTPEDTMALFESLGVPLKTERGNRVFPVSDNARDIADALCAYCKKTGVEILPSSKVSELLIEGDQVVGVRLERGETILGRAVVLATGGKSYPGTGSDGSGYRLAEEAGHTIVPLRPSLIPILCEESCCKEMMGLSLKNVTLSLYEESKKKPLYSELGEMLFTHFGVSGPLVLSASSYMKKDAANYRLFIDLKPGLSREQLDARLLRDFEEESNRSFGVILNQLLPSSMVPVMAEKTGIALDTRGHQITREDRNRLMDWVKAFPLHPTGLRPVEEAVVTAGGVSVKEADPKTMASKLVKGLYFAGEVLDLDAYTGGFNLQIAFCTAVAAAYGMAEWLKGETK